MKRLVLLYVIWSAIYLLWQIPYNNSIGWTGFEAVKDYVVSFFLNSSFYHFWYFLCLIYGVVALYFALRVFNVKVVLVLAACCNADTAVRFRKMSTLIYCIHPMIINLLGLIKGYDAVNSLIHFLLVSSISIAFSLLFILLQRNRCFSWMKFMY